MLLTSAVPTSSTVPQRRKGAKLLVVGTATPRVQIYDIRQQTCGYTLEPSCVVDVPAVPAEDGGEALPPPVSQLRAKGTANCVWILVLLPNRVVHAYLAPVVEAPIVEAVGLETLKEEDEEEGEVGAAKGEGADEFSGVLKIKTPTFVLPLPDMAPLRGLPEPALSEVVMMLLAPRPEALTRRNRRPVPAYCFVCSQATGSVAAFGLNCPGPASAASGLAVEEMLKVVEPPPYEVKEPAESQTVLPCRHWTMPARNSAVAAASDGSIFAVGGSHGALSLISIGAGPALTLCLPGHYGAVAALAFYKSEVLVSVGADAWVHHYCLRTNNLLFRHMCTPPPSPQPAPGRARGLTVDAASCTPPPSPPPGVAVAVSPSRARGLTLDAAGNLRILDLHRGKKLARASCQIEDSTVPTSKHEDPSSSKCKQKQGAPEVSPGQCLRLFCTADSFCVVREGEPDRKEASARQASRASIDASAAGKLPSSPTPPASGQESSVLFFFHDASLVSAPSAPTAPSLMAVDRDAQRGGDVTLIVQRGDEATQEAGRGVKGKIVALTAENLRMMGKPGNEKGEHGDLTGDLSNAARKDLRSVGVSQRAHRMPESWQTAVRQHLRSSCADRNLRAGRIPKRMDTIRRRIEENVAASVATGTGRSQTRT
eukprot:TRINITY_DN37519_c0_g1_i1.p1 TRINITY_DN37519_c0_g1~~TRINITY_DN37519_c0_g1_i1.p1  ORF type:complete len:654 (+),score=98.01 TRINITY_DN37519_c0_g1_i1:363-2324(+)